MKKFLRFQMELEGTDETRDMTDDFVGQLNTDYALKRGLYIPAFRDNVAIGAHTENNTIVLYGEFTGATRKECKALYSALKKVAKSVFPTCKKATDILVGEGDKLW